MVWLRRVSSPRGRPPAIDALPEVWDCSHLSMSERSSRSANLWEMVRCCRLIKPQRRPDPGKLNDDTPPGLGVV
jgi:hypothetical protein